MIGIKAEYFGDWMPETESIDFGLVNTPSTSYAFIFCYD